jgi:hypothetical protein
MARNETFISHVTTGIVSQLYHQVTVACGNTKWPTHRTRKIEPIDAVKLCILLYI